MTKIKLPLNPCSSTHRIFDSWSPPVPALCLALVTRGRATDDEDINAIESMLFYSEDSCLLESSSSSSVSGPGAKRKSD